MFDQLAHPIHKAVVLQIQNRSFFISIIWKPDKVRGYLNSFKGRRARLMAYCLSDFMCHVNGRVRRRRRLKRD